jgi:hypothetical protein
VLVTSLAGIIALRFFYFILLLLIHLITWVKYMITSLEEGTYLYVASFWRKYLLAT